jgi:hypothetical protein
MMHQSLENDNRARTIQTKIGIAQNASNKYARSVKSALIIVVVERRRERRKS